MNKARRKSLLFIVTALFLMLSACSNNQEEKKKDGDNEHENEMTEEKADMKHGDMNHSGSGKVPEGLKEASSPKYEVGSQAVLKADHMEGMKEAESTISGAYETVVYTVTYEPTTGGEKVEDHKWVVHEELKDVGDEPYKSGDEVILNADHMKGMKGARATIDSAEETIVYMVDYTPTSGGKEVKNHKWVTESELSPVE
ncbi:YdhK family protein [Rossellomorea arthrocnemi]|uniref:YdhK family protein n=1 Tax=Rossellomorea arthrocnemi TaxID=2769542 RepID=UPI00191986DD|nr:YdhK family protein [Rossellomorea arthrocnemi]